MTDKQRHYYQARGFSTYYFANVAYNVVKNCGSYLQGVEDILGDMQTTVLMRPFHRFTNLHHFLTSVVAEILHEEVEQLGIVKPEFLLEFLKIYDVPHASEHLEDEEAFYEFTSESDRYQDALEELADEVFHVLFNDVAFLEMFNGLCADYIRDTGFGTDLKTLVGTLKRVSVPAWAQLAVFHRDKGECRDCKRSLAGMINQLETERYDHIIPLARFGPNDVTNLQLLCEPCNLKKAASLQSVSRLYQRAITRR
ncbi:hypothetical protein ASD54_07715 [Rhizobium sp. Root149]|uniref:HNH endonuclease n=1 Tax=Rhizobium sp. Root149 TaxID=1736473 RepID=UPI000712EC73|nr:HNH endonuclease [Rhizobium sp. Root149]KQZ55154.1 hypothetical protein ASD54_07715 [Rhizobium sp. Root149]